MAKTHNVAPTILDAVDEVNNLQKNVLMHKIEDHYGGTLAGMRFCRWGLAFKPKTDDIREAPALVLMDQLLQLGASVCVYDPEAMENVARSMVTVDFVDRSHGCLARGTRL